LEEWNALSELLPRLKKSRAMNKAEQAELEETLFAGKIMRMKDQAGLEHLWDQISSERKIFPKILADTSKNP